MTGLLQDFLLKTEATVVEETAAKRLRSEAGCQTCPPLFYTEWEEAVRRTVWQPGYIPRPEPPGPLRGFQRQYLAWVRLAWVSAPILGLDPACLGFSGKIWPGSGLLGF